MKHHLAAVVMALACLLGTQSMTQELLHSRRDYPVGLGPNTVLIEDVTGDGINDMVVSSISWYATTEELSLMVLSGFGDGTYADPVRFGSESGARSIGLGDFNEDGYVDVIASYDGLVIYANDGLGSFDSVAHVATPITIERLSVGDINGDTHLDIYASSHYYYTDFVALYGDGANGFSMAGEFQTPSNCFSVEAGDVNGDSLVDLVATHIAGVTCYLNDGDSMFVEGDTYAGEDWIETSEIVNVSGASIGDLDGDQDADIAVFCGIWNPMLFFGSAGYLVILANDGLGNFSGSVIDTASGFESYHRSLPNLCDLDLDGGLDVVVNTPYRIHVWHNDGAMTFDSVISVEMGASRYMTTGELTADEFPDIASVGRSNPEDIGFVSVIRNDGAGGFNAARMSETRYGCHTIRAADFDGDGDIDLASSEAGFGGDQPGTAEGSMLVHLNDGSGNLSVLGGWVLTGSHAYRGCIGDVDGDGVTDLAVDGFDRDVWSYASYLSLNDGSGTMGYPTEFVGRRLRNLVDVNGDGYVDWITVDSVLLNDGAGQFACYSSFHMGYNESPNDFDPHAFADINGDGHVDVAACIDGEVRARFGDGGGHFGTTVVLFSGYEGSVATVVDVDGDLVLDIILGIEAYWPWEPDSLLVLQNNSDSTCEIQAVCEVANFSVARQVVAADINADFEVDLICTNETGHNVAILLSSGIGFNDPIYYGAGDGAWALQVADFNADGLLDIATGNYGSTIAVLINTGDEVTIGCCGLYTGGMSGNTNCSQDGKLTLTDITTLIDHIYISHAPLCCYATGNTNGSTDCKLTLGDITRLIDVIYISKAPPEPCLQSCDQ
jgi:hypothetical protein